MKKREETVRLVCTQLCSRGQGYDSATNHRFEYASEIGVFIPLGKTAAAEGMYAEVFVQDGAVTSDEETPVQFIHTQVVEDGDYHLIGCPAVGCELKERGNGAEEYCRSRCWVKFTDENVRVVGGKLARASPLYRRKYKKRPSIERFFSDAKETRFPDAHRYIKPSKLLTHAG